jgi:alpha-galactosidase
MDPQQWYPGGFPTGTGNWEIDRAKYPNGLKPIGDAVRVAGMGYLLWFEPERVHPGTKVEREHPEWVMKAEGEWSQLFRMHDPDARKWLTNLVDTFVTEAQLAWIRWDFNIEPLTFWQRNDTPDRVGMTEIRHIEGLYAMWEELERRHPGLLIDNCSSGGRRLDIEAARYGLPLWHSDMHCLDQNVATGDQLQNAGLNRWVPFHGCANFSLEPSYAFRSAMTSGNILIQALAPDGEEEVRRSIALYERLRPYMLGDFYSLFPHTDSPDVWFGYQFHRPEPNDGFAMVFRRERSSDSVRVLHLRGIDVKASYVVSVENAQDGDVVTGSNLAAFPMEIPEQPGSVLVWYRAK